MFSTIAGKTEIIHCSVKIMAFPLKGSFYYMGTTVWMLCKFHLFFYTWVLLYNF